jgi:hypothetical protein
MKTKNLKIIPILFSITLLTITTISCSKKTPAPTTDANGLPFATQTGANTFGCLIVGVPCSVSGEYNWLYTYGVEYNLGGGELRIKVITQNPRKDFYIMCKLNTKIIGSHKANQDMNPGYSSLDLVGGVVGSSYIANESLPANIIVSKFSGNPTLGRQNGDILSGTFDMVLQNVDGKKSI